MTEMFGEAWPPMSVPDLASDDDDDLLDYNVLFSKDTILKKLVEGDTCNTCMLIMSFFSTTEGSKEYIMS